MLRIDVNTTWQDCHTLLVINSAMVNLLNLLNLYCNMHCILVKKTLNYSVVINVLAVFYYLYYCNSSVI